MGIHPERGARHNIRVKPPPQSETATNLSILGAISTVFSHIVPSQINELSMTAGIMGRDETRTLP